ncbi:IS66 family transposase [Burkholderia cenocepacia]|nr:IS66 family transposase [Burkholderia cenocepacia]MCW3510967.1 IS66 family transposase [Burkholderia cenocepacia]MCW3518791.1 IS66 family transposase [Burkholderia cenocepacia]MCW3533932.1 IS66 family transposase [Burkholderia cenocepacia]MCW3549114.1 IS66 family transposase [Burkholderia cenocepacia]
MGGIWLVSCFRCAQSSRCQRVVYEFAGSRAGVYACMFVKGWHGRSVCNDYDGYRAAFQQCVTEIACPPHARRKFFELHADHSKQIDGQALQLFIAMYDVEREAAEELGADERQ